MCCSWWCGDHEHEEPLKYASNRLYVLRVTTLVRHVRPITGAQTICHTASVEAAHLSFAVVAADHLKMAVADRKTVCQ